MKFVCNHIEYSSFCTYRKHKKNQQRMHFISIDAENVRNILCYGIVMLLTFCVFFSRSFSHSCCFHPFSLENDNNEVKEREKYYPEPELNNEKNMENFMKTENRQMLL